jgi:uncharacterized protein (TIRG00374 family)
VATFFVLVLVVEYLVLPQVAGARKSLHLLGQVRVALVLLGVVLEAASLLAYAELTRAVLPPNDRPGLFTLLRIQFSTLAVSHVLPGGTAAGAGLGYRLLNESGVSGTNAGFALATQGLGSAVVLNVLLWLSLVVSIPLRGFNPLYGTAAFVGALLIAGFASLVLLLTKGTDRAANLMCRIAGRIPGLEADAVERLIRRLAVRVQELMSNRKVLVRAGAWAAANWLLDAASLWVFVAAFGYRMGPDGLLVSYGLANVLAAIPITPGGLGVIETVLTSALVGFGAPRGIAILGVISWRLVNFWLPIPAGAIAYVSLRVEPGAPTQRKKDELRQLAADLQSGRLSAPAKEGPGG